MNKKAIFFTFTTLHLVLCISYYEKYLKSKGVQAYFVFNEKRFKSFSFVNFPYKYTLIKNDLNEVILKPDLKFLEIFQIKNAAYIITPLPASILVLSVCKFSLVRKIKLVSLEDGLATGIPFNLRYQIQYRLTLIFRKYINRIPYLPNSYWSDSYICSLSDTYIGSNNIFKHPNFINSKSLLDTAINLNIIKAIFNIDIDDIKNADILFFTQPISLKYKGYINKVFQLLQLSGLRVFVKVHPAEKMQDYAKYKAENITLSDNLAPAELLLKCLNNKKILSFYSTVSILSEGLENLWIYPILEDEKLTKRIEHRQYNNVKVIKNLDLLKTELTL